MRLICVCFFLHALFIFHFDKILDFILTYLISCLYVFNLYKQFLQFILYPKVYMHLMEYLKQLAYISSQHKVGKSHLCFYNCIFIINICFKILESINILVFLYQQTFTTKYAIHSMVFVYQITLKFKLKYVSSK